MPDVTVSLEEDGEQGRFVAVRGGVFVGEMTFKWRRQRTMIVVDHTGVEPDEQNRGVGQLLFETMVEWSRENQVTVVPICPFAKALFERFPETQDVL